MKVCRFPVVGFWGFCSLGPPSCYSCQIWPDLWNHTCNIPFTCSIYCIIFIYIFMMLFVQKYGQFQRFHIQYFILPVWLLKSYPIESWSLRQGRWGKVQRVKDIVLKLRYWGTCLDCSQSQATATQSPKQLLGWWGLNDLPWFWWPLSSRVCLHALLTMYTSTNIIFFPLSVGEDGWLRSQA